MVAIAKEKAVAEYLLVEVDSSEEKGIFNLFYYLKLYHLKWLKISTQKTYWSFYQYRYQVLNKRIARLCRPTS